MYAMYAVLDCRTQGIIEVGQDREVLFDKYDDLGLYCSDWYITEMEVAIDRRTKQVLAYGLTNEEIYKALNYDMDRDFIYIGKYSDFNRFTWIFLNEETNEYIAMKDFIVTADKIDGLAMAGFKPYSDIVLHSQYSVEEYLTIHEVDAEPANLHVKQVTLKDAQAFINSNHRHHKQPQGHRFSLGLYAGKSLVGVIVAGRPVARANDDGNTLEVTRCCVLQGFQNAVTILYGRIYQTAKLWGYKRVITYTLSTEEGYSMKAAGFNCIGLTKGGSWNSATRQRKDKHPTIPKYKWEKAIC